MLDDFPGDRLARSGYAAIAVAILTTIGPILVDGVTLICTWAIQGSLLWWLARQQRALYLAWYGSAVGLLAYLATVINWQNQGFRSSQRLLNFSVI